MSIGSKISGMTAKKFETESKIESEIDQQKVDTLKSEARQSKTSASLPNPLPMFPLGSVLLPGQILPLHIFEPRYREMMAHCLGEDDRGEDDTGEDDTGENNTGKNDTGDKLFGVVLIERGSEVGGDDIRTNVGTVARIVSHRVLDGGRMAVLAVGEQRMKVVEWLEDDPYPRAIAEVWPCEDKADLADDDLAELDDLARLFATAEAAVRRVWALRREMGATEPEPAENYPRTSVGSFGLAARIPLQQFDRQKLLVAPSVAERLSLLEELLTDHEELLLARLSNG